MTDLATALDTALQADGPLVFVAFDLALPGNTTLALLDGAGTLEFGNLTYLGLDPTYGTLGSVEAIADGSTTTAAHVKVTLLPPTNTAAADLANPDIQGCEARLWMGAVTPSTGAVVVSPYLLFDGVVDVPTLSVGTGTRQIELDIASVFERLFDIDEGVGLNDSSHEDFWPGEEGFIYVTDVTRILPWGADAVRPTVVTDKSSAVTPDQVNFFGNFFGG